jgi:hypothetical protein
MLANTDYFQKGDPLNNNNRRVQTKIIFLKSKKIINKFIRKSIYFWKRSINNKSNTIIRIRCFPTTFGKILPSLKQESYRLDIIFLAFIFKTKSKLSKIIISNQKGKKLILMIREMKPSTIILTLHIAIYPIMPFGHSNSKLCIKYISLNLKIITRTKCSPITFGKIFPYLKEELNRRSQGFFLLLRKTSIYRKMIRRMTF